MTPTQGATFDPLHIEGPTWKIRRVRSVKMSSLPVGKTLSIVPQAVNRRHIDSDDPGRRLDFPICWSVRSATMNIWPIGPTVGSVPRPVGPMLDTKGRGVVWTIQSPGRKNGDRVRPRTGYPKSNSPGSSGTVGRFSGTRDLAKYTHYAR